MIQGHGDDGYLYDRPVVADFSSNVWRGGLQPGLQQHLATKLPGIAHYPDAGAARLQGMLETQAGLGAEMVMVTNGATEAIYLVAQAFAGATTTIVAPAFAEYADAGKLHRHQLQYLLWDKLTADTRFSSDLVFLCNPNNPTGHALEESALKQLIQGNKHTVFVIDEAYIHFTRQATSLLSHLHHYPNVLVLRSLTKNVCIPGLRLGYVAGRKSLLDRVRAGRMPWAVNSLALEAGYYILEHPADFIIPLDELLADTYRLWENIRQLPEFKVYPTHTHFLLFETLTGTAARLKAWLLEQEGILIRDASNFYGLEQGHCRVACRHPADNDLLTSALYKWTLH
ncbi:pyridoxal phosphate-dependent aminotransferase [Chitinophaga nivalis]|uniref:Aminotransferase class I/II-fold pyridoxal phosphate-dependent enzyme n=1 Tax=Chitinophaga nivalis TaxID=2991709 RepID=A0ABT3IIF8_9BACT|nr:aminotransferase class I/II-fold pyridoxal phosphate-dependent enzyme [Chitinophaga nivalis]MCW3466586.1 aminotransferase class I/II-fold pyridoxal phosphate-dependent enzyme [Chitinophaga nivalis]MCW3483723.1 aminotransferase class I/II-fold pyridoxal phosphate-dependent enzyme [Chitinophaga nivalis]